MKRFLMILVGVLAIVSCAKADEQISHNVSVLPQNAQTLLQANFSDRTLSYVKTDRGSMGVKDYEVVYSDGTQVEFDRDGNLTEVDVQRAGLAVPNGLIPAAIRNYVSTQYPGQRISKLEIEPRHIDVELGNGVELRFDKQGNFQRQH